MRFFAMKFFMDANSHNEAPLNHDDFEFMGGDFRWYGSCGPVLSLFRQFSVHKSMRCDAADWRHCYSGVK
jgi:hypothetical protein